MVQGNTVWIWHRANKTVLKVEIVTSALFDQHPKIRPLPLHLPTEERQFIADLLWGRGRTNRRIWFLSRSIYFLVRFVDRRVWRMPHAAVLVRAVEHSIATGKRDHCTRKDHNLGSRQDHLFWRSHCTRVLVFFPTANKITSPRLLWLYFMKDKSRCTISKAVIQHNATCRCWEWWRPAVRRQWSRWRQWKVPTNHQCHLWKINSFWQSVTE